jgi:hypothetical protein
VLAFDVEDPTLWCSLSLGLVIALIHLLTCRRRGTQAELSAFIEILFYSMGVAVAIKVAKLAITLPGDANHTLTSEDRVYFCFGAIALAWVSIESIIRRFK